MEIKFTHSPDEFDAKVAADMLTRRTKKHRPTYVILLIVFCALAFLAPADHPIRPAFCFLAGVLALDTYRAFAHSMNVRKALKSIPGFMDTNSYRISTEGIDIEAPCCKATQYWSHFQSFTESQTHFFLMKGTYPSLRVPKRVINESEQESLRQLLKEKLPMK